MVIAKMKRKYTWLNKIWLFLSEVKKGLGRNMFKTPNIPFAVQQLLGPPGYLATDRLRSTDVDRELMSPIVNSQKIKRSLSGDTPGGIINSVKGEIH